MDPVAPATDTLGQAAASVRLGTIPGDQAIEAQVVRPGQDLQVRFRLTAVAKPAGGGAGGSGGSGGGGVGGGGGTDGGGGGGHGPGHDKGEGHGNDD